MGATGTVNGTATIKSGGRLIVTGSDRIDPQHSNIFQNGKLQILPNATLTIENGGELSYNAVSGYGRRFDGGTYRLNLTQGTPGINSGKIINKGDIIISDNGKSAILNPTDEDADVYVMAGIKGPENLARDSWIFANGTKKTAGNDAADRGNLVLGKYGMLRVDSADEEHVFKFSDISIKGITSDELRNRSYRSNDTADIYYVNDVDDSDVYPVIHFDSSDVDFGTGFNEKGLRLIVKGTGWLKGDSSGSFTLDNGTLNLYDLELDKSLKTIAINNNGYLGLNAEDNEIDLNGVNFTINHNDPRESALEVEGQGRTVTNFGDIDIKNGYVGIYQSKLTKIGKLSISGKGPAKENMSLFDVSEGSNVSVTGLSVSTDGKSEWIDDYYEGTFDQNKTYNGLHVTQGKLTVEGTSAAKDVSYTDNSILIYGTNGSSVTFKNNALDYVASTGKLHDGFNKIKATKGAIINLEFDGSVSLTDAQKKAIKEQILAAGSTATINFGSAADGGTGGGGSGGSGDNSGGSIGDLGPADASGRYSYEKFRELNPDSDPSFTGDKLTKNVFTVNDQNTRMLHTIGAVHAVSGDSVVVSGAHAGLVNAGKNGGFYASRTENGKIVAADIKISGAGSHLNLKGGGSAGVITVDSGANLAVADGGGNTFAAVNGGGSAVFAANTTIKGDVEVGNLEIAGATVTVNNLKNVSDSSFRLKNGRLNAKTMELRSSASAGQGGYAKLDVGDIKLGGNSLTLRNESSTTSVANFKTVDGGSVIRGRLIARGSSFIGVGYDSLEDFTKNLESNGIRHKTSDGAYIAFDKPVTINGGALIVGDDSSSQQKSGISSFAAGAGGPNSIVYGKNGHVIVNVNNMKSGESAIKFEGGSGSVVENGGTARIVLTGAVNSATSYKIFDNLSLTEDQSVKVTSANGAMAAEVNKDNVSQDVKLDITPAGYRLFGSKLSAPVRDLVVSVAGKKPQEGEDINGVNFLNTAFGGTQDVVVIERAARLATLAGTAQAAYAVSDSTSSSIRSRLSGENKLSGNTASGVGVWINPVYNKISGDSLSSDGLSAGVDADFTGAAFGLDYEFAPGFTAGAMFNVGSGSADSSSVGPDAKNDFNYYGLGVYAGYSAGSFFANGDFSYTTLNGDLETSSDLQDYGKLTADADTSVLSIGVEGGYRFAFSNGLGVTPHAGLRYSRIDVDDYSVKSGDATLAKTDLDTMNLISLPLGVKFDFSIDSADLTIRPSLDLRFSINAGDRDQSYRTVFSGADPVSLNSAIFDSFTYGAKAGIEFGTGTTRFGADLSYDRSSNYNSFGIQGNFSHSF